MPDGIKNSQQALHQMTQTLNAMHLSQLTAYAYGLPPLFFCSQYFQLNDETIIDQCNERLIKLVSTEEITLERISQLLIDKEYFDAEEARLRVAPSDTE